jgi:hypothetical protein
MMKLLLATVFAFVAATAVQARPYNAGDKVTFQHPVPACHSIDAAYHIVGLLSEIAQYTGLHSVRLMQQTPYWSAISDFVSSQGDGCANLPDEAVLDTGKDFDLGDNDDRAVFETVLIAGFWPCPSKRGADQHRQGSVVVTAQFSTTTDNPSS